MVGFIIGFTKVCDESYDSYLVNNEQWANGISWDTLRSGYTWLGNPHIGRPSK